MGNGGWIGVDLDGTLAHYGSWEGPTHVGEPIMPMVNRVLDWVNSGKDVRIVTARVSPSNGISEEEIQEVRDAIDDWCEEHLGRTLPITHCKDYGMIELWDDRCVQVVPNTGYPLTDFIEKYKLITIGDNEYDIAEEMIRKHS